MNDYDFIGAIKLFAGNFAPRGWLFCKGETLQIDRYQALYSILGTQYGGDGRLDFQLPNIEPVKENDGGTTPIHYIICIDGRYPSRH